MGFQHNVHGQAPPPGASLEEVKEWVKSIDKNKDGVISKEELAEALRGLHLWFTRFRSRGAVKHADLNKNGVIDTEKEFDELVQFAQKRWGQLINAA